jgi:enoyl-CoA hydratase/carnithine racemase
VSADVSYETIHYDVAGRVARITLNRPAARNALSAAMTEELIDALARVGADDAVRVAVLTGAGDKAFCAGADLSDFGRSSGSVARPAGAITDSPPYRLFTAFPRLGKPIIARLGGHALAAGLGLALSCDLVIAADDVKLGTPEVNVGLWPMVIMAIINRHLPPQQALKLYYTGRPVPATEAVRLGLVTETVPRDRLDDRVNELADLIAAKSPIGLRIGRDAFYALEVGEPGGRPFDDQIAYLLDRLGEVTATADAKEGIRAFLEKRTPEFDGR